MSAEMTDNLLEWLEDKAREFNPNFSTSEGTAVRDLFVKPFSVIFQPIADEIIRIRENLSLKNAENLSEEDLDLLAANFFVTRRTGSKSTGSVRVFFNEAVDEFLAQGTVFIAASGARFLSTADTTITSTGLRLNTYGDLFYWDVDVEAESVGEAGNIPADLISDTESGSDKIVDVSNPAAFSGGTEAESNAELLDRLAIAITFRNLLNDPGAKLILLENFPRLLDVLVVGFGDTHKITGENLGTVSIPQTVFQLSETEDVIATSIDVYTAVADELVLTGPVSPGFKVVADFPYTGDSLELKAGASFLAGTALTVTTDFSGGSIAEVADELIATTPVAAGTYNLAFGITADPGGLGTITSGSLKLYKGPVSSAVALTAVTHYTNVNYVAGTFDITAAGATFLAGADLHGKYSATTTLNGAFSLYQSGATIVNAAVPPQLHAKYSAGPLDASLVDVLTAGFNGTITFTTSPLPGTTVTADFEFYLMRRDRMSGNNLVLGDDTFGTVTYAHIGGKVDYYLKFLGLEENELRINGIKDTIFLWEKTTNDPTPAATEMYVTGLTHPIAPIKNIELVDPGTNLPSGTFLAEANPPVGPNQYHLSIITNKLNVNLSTRQRIKIEVSPDVLTRDIFFRYFSHQDFAAVQAFVDDPANRIVTADLLVRAPMPVFVDIDLTYSRATDGPDADTVKAEIVNYINGLKLGKCLAAYDIANAVSTIGVKYLQLPITMTARRINLDFSETTITTQNQVLVPPNYQFIANNVTVTEVDLSTCVTI